ncbi:hypothetical protein ABWI00_21595 [Algihabitans albus]|uniref:hypothetical protein n=1 Tax=Algihabitans albus TaxID=2164067 RepID=UPI0035CFF067
MTSAPPPEDPLESMPLQAAFREMALALEAKTEGRTAEAIQHATAVSPLLVRAILEEAEL